VALTEGRIVECVAPRGSHVKKGDTIFIIHNEELPLKIKQAESNILSARAQKHSKENQYKRFLLLKEKDAVSAQQFDDAEAAYHAAEGQLEVAEAQLGNLRLQEERQKVIAPLDGQVLMLYRQQGAYVRGGMALALVGDFRKLYFSTAVNDMLAQHLSLGQEVDMLFSNTHFKKVYDGNFAAGNLGEKQTFIASIAEIRPPFSEPAVMRNVIWQTDNGAGLLEPQTYGGVSLQARKAYETLTVPMTAMIDSGNDDVFVVKSDNTLEKRAVKTGTNDGTYIEILEGLSEGEVVITSGAEGLKNGMRVTVSVQGGDAK
jgi:RND family efflux transporter MFP subunit